MTTTGHAVAPGLYKKLPFDPIKDFAPASQMIGTYLVLVANPTMPSNLKDLVAVAKQIQRTEGYATIIAADAMGRVNAIAEVPDAMLDGKTKMEQMKAMAHLRRFARMTGSGACVFAAFASESEADAAVQSVPAAWRGWKARSLAVHPMVHLLQS